MSTYDQRSREKLLNRSKEYCEHNTDRIRDQARNKYRKLFDEKKNIKENIEKIDIKICQKKIKKD